MAEPISVFPPFVFSQSGDGTPSGTRVVQNLDVTVADGSPLQVTIVPATLNVAIGPSSIIVP